MPEELEPLLEWFGHGVVVGVFVEGAVVLELAGVVVVVVEAAPDITVPRPRPSPRVLPATPTPNRNFLRDDAMLCSFDYRPKRWRANCPIRHSNTRTFGPAESQVSKRTIHGVRSGLGSGLGAGCPRINMNYVGPPFGRFT